MVLSPEPIRLGPVTLEQPTVLAPMAGVTDRDFRLIIRRIGGVGLVTMEFISSKMLMQGDKRITKLLTYAEEERPLSIQVYGSDAKTMADAARVVEERGADIVDINMGCPANKVLKGCAGAALMGDLKLAEEIVRDVTRAVSIPVTVKFRLGLDDRRRNFLELGRICEQHGVAAVAMHARTAAQRYTGQATWDDIGELVDVLSIPVLGNGDVKTADDALAMLERTGCAGVMVGRGATRNPWLFLQIAAKLSQGRLPEPTLEDRRRLVVDHFRTVQAREDETMTLHKMRTFTHWYSHGLPDGKALRRQIGTPPNAAAFLKMIEQYFEDQLAAESAVSVAA
ncbi:MAG: tRNA dihydrouridine synthase DusB [Acidobacteriota bacterium]